MGCVLEIFYECCNSKKKNNNRNNNEQAGKEFELDLIKDSENKNNKNNFSNIYESRIGFFNLGASCYMASILQILIHLRSFIEKFRSKGKRSKNSLSKLFNELIDKIIRANYSIEISNFANEYMKINSKFSGKHGNNPMTFFTEFINKLGEENKDILDLFTIINYIKFQGLDENDYEEKLFFYMISIDNNIKYIRNAINKEKEMEEDKNIKIIERITLKPEIFIINLQVEDIEYNFEEKIFIDKTKYDLKAINEYNNSHSTA